MSEERKPAHVNPRELKDRQEIYREALKVLEGLPPWVKKQEHALQLLCDLFVLADYGQATEALRDEFQIALDDCVALIANVAPIAYLDLGAETLANLLYDALFIRALEVRGEYQLVARFLAFRKERGADNWRALTPTRDLRQKLKMRQRPGPEYGPGAPPLSGVSTRDGALALIGDAYRAIVEEGRNPDGIGELDLAEHWNLRDDRAVRDFFGRWSIDWVEERRRLRAKEERR